ncbi:zinc-binding dehydrogenase [Actinomadura atramentaria]|uniref:zinc-binding dehydrogenase n=1 Tax=Actinomadura atramentaria TaxID=1990 RepID=UPI00035F0E90|nr:zinc-binding dehydrogenase [Actinomadura atramentaria]
MKVVRVSEYGSPDVLRLADAPEPEPSSGQVVVDVERAGVLYADTIIRSGRFPVELPYVAGFEVGGRVTAVGPDVDPSWLGRRVATAAHGDRGGYAERALADAADLHALPDGLGAEQAVAVLSAGALALGILDAMRVRPDDSLLVTAAGGRLGSLLVQFAKAAGVARVVGAASNAAKLAAAADAGADVTVDYSRPDWVERVQDATGGGADVVVDAVGGTIGEQALAAAATGRGRVGIYGFASGEWTPLDTMNLLARGLTVSGPIWNIVYGPADERHAVAEKALRAAADGTVTARVDATYALDEAAEAHRRIEDRSVVGALQLVP